MSLSISFSDLLHTGHSCNTIPYGIAMVASYAVKVFQTSINVELFKYPTSFINYIESCPPAIACFSNYIWNSNLSYGFAERIKTKFPDIIIIFGGPNYPLNSKEQEAFLKNRPAIDFYVFRDAEQAFVELLEVIIQNDLDVERIKKSKKKIHNCHYITDDAFVCGELLPCQSNLDDIPSPYLTGLCDKFFNSELVPLLQVSRGCPFSCTYCQNGHEYFNKIHSFSNERIFNEIDYIASRANMPNLMLADSNFGMYKNDITICNYIRKLQDRLDWPRYFIGIDGKNNKQRVLQAASIVKGSQLDAAIQSTNSEVLKNIKRKNVSFDQMIQVAIQSEETGSNSFSEVILCLPGDTIQAHHESNAVLIDAGINVVRSHQFIMLPASESAQEKDRKQYGMGTRFRVTPKTVNPYKLFGETFYAPEIDEICVENKTMSYSEYLGCRLFNLTIEIFYNNGVLKELIHYLKLHRIKISAFLFSIHKKIREKSDISHATSSLYQNFLKETNELWKSREALIQELSKPEVISQYLSCEMGNNEQLVYRALFFFKQMNDLHHIAFSVALEILEENKLLTDNTKYYLKELFVFSLAKKDDILSINKSSTHFFHYNFLLLFENNFEIEPDSHYLDEGIEVMFFHDDKQKKLISDYIDVYGLTNFGLGTMLSNASHINSFYRKIKII